MSRSWQTPPECFKRDADLVTAWAAGHMSSAGSAPIWSDCAPGELLSRLPLECPTQPCDVASVLEELEQNIVPGLVRWDAPGWFAWFPSNAQPHALLGDLLASCMAQQGMLWLSSPACTEVEIRALEWLRQAMGLPMRFAEGGRGGGVIQDTASSAVLCCLVAARDRATNGEARRGGLQRIEPPLTAYASADAHSMVLKAMHVSGMGAAQFRPVPHGAGEGMGAEALRSVVDRDVEAGCRPVFCCATVGSTACGAIDDVDEIARLCADYGMWMHVDAAWAGTAALHEAYRPSIIRGAEKADSWCFNPHKWMGVNFDCSCLWIADRASLNESMSVIPEFLRNERTESGEVVDYRDWHVQLGRRFRALKIWLLLRCTGVGAIADMVQHHIDLAAHLEAGIERIESVELAVPRSLSLVCIRHVEGDDATQRMLDAVNAHGRLAATHCRLDGRLVMRVAVGSLQVEQSNIDTLLETIELSD